MHRNTIIFILFLAVMAALLVGINVGKMLSGPQQLVPTPLPSVMTNLDPSPTLLPSPAAVYYELTECGVAFEYESNYSLTEASRGAQLTPQAELSAESQAQQINVACANNVPRPPLPRDKIEVATIAGLRVNRYHDTSARDGSPIDAVIFTHPENGLDIAILGFGEAYNQLLTTLKLLP